MKYEVKISGEILPLNLDRKGDDFVLKLADREIQGKIIRWDPPFFTVQHCDHLLQGAFYRSAEFVDVHLPKGNFRIRFATKSRQSKAGHGLAGLTSPMPGKVLKVYREEGDSVKTGDVLMMLEAMKMEHKIVAPQDGKVKKIFFKEGERVGQDVELLEVESSELSPAKNKSN